MDEHPNDWPGITHGRNFRELVKICMRNVYECVLYIVY